MKCAGNYTLPDLEYSVNNEPWQKVVALGLVNFGGNLGSLRLRGKCYNGTATNDKEFSRIDFGNLNVKVNCFGDIRTLIDYTAYKTVATGNCRFISLFKGCSVLTSAPQLPATELKDYCYNSMFEGCTSLEQAPDLPATVLKESCYQSMFTGCTALVKVPKKLPAKELDNYCYESMFKGCTSLTKAPELRATKIMEGCYKSMFEDCKKLISVTMLATEYGSESLSGWLDGAGTEAESRILKVNNWEAYKNIITNLPPIWQRGSKCILWDKDGNKITTTE